MGFFGWLFGKNKKTRTDTDLDAEIDDISSSDEMNVEDDAEINSKSNEKINSASNAKSNEKINSASNAKSYEKTSAASNAKSNEKISAASNSKSKEKISAASNAITNEKTSAKTATSKQDSSVKNDEVASEKATSRAGAIEIYKDAKGKFRFRIKSSNACTVAHSQGYTSKASCKNGFVSISKTTNIVVADTITDKDYVPTIGKAVFEIYKDKEEKFRFRYRAANLNTILASQGYTTKANCINGINSVQKLLTNYIIDDFTKK